MGSSNSLLLASPDAIDVCVLRLSVSLPSGQNGALSPAGERVVLDVLMRRSPAECAARIGRGPNDKHTVALARSNMSFVQ